MGMYTELIFGASLKESTPKEVIDVLKWMVNRTFEDCSKEINCVIPFHPFFQSERWKYLFHMGSYYFAINNGRAEFNYDKIRKSWWLSSRSNLKNYDNEIEKFLEWIRPYLEQGSGERNFYAIVCYEESNEPTIYYLDNIRD